jgi:hypothetical protein
MKRELDFALNFAMSVFLLAGFDRGGAECDNNCDQEEAKRRSEHGWRELGSEWDHDLNTDNAGRRDESDERYRASGFAGSSNCNGKA